MQFLGRNHVILWCLLALLLPLTARGEDLPAVVATAQAHATGDEAVYRITLRIPEGFALYHTTLGHPKAIGIPLSARPTAGAKLLALTTSQPHKKEQMLFDGSEKSAQINVHDKEMMLWLRVALAAPDAPLPQVLIKGQMCNESQCLPVNLTLTPMPTIAAFADAPALPIDPTLQNAPPPATTDNLPTVSPQVSRRMALKTIGNDAPAPESAVISDGMPREQYPTTLPQYQPHGDAPERSLLLWFALAFLAGVILNFMPCVLPVVSLKLLSFASQAGESHSRSIVFSLAFSAGILTVFLLLGAAAAFFGMQWGEQFQSEAFNITLVAIIFAFALSFFGVYEFGLPGALSSLPGGGKPARDGLVGSFLTGAVSTLLATPCSGPFLGAALAWALTQPTAVVLAMFACIGTGMASPYILLSASSRLRRLLPRPGSWMLTLRRALGYIMLLTAVYLLFFIRPENIVPTAGLLVAVALGCEIVGKFSLRQARIRWFSRFAALLIIAASVWLFFVLIKPALNPAADAAQARPFDYAEFTQTLREGKNVLVDFTADWCPNCKYNEHFVLTTRMVQERMREKHVVYFVADMTEDNERTAFLKRFMNALGGRAIPFAAVFGHDAPLRPHPLPDILGVTQVLKILDTLPAPRTDTAAHR